MDSFKPHITQISQFQRKEWRRLTSAMGRDSAHPFNPNPFHPRYLRFGKSGGCMNSIVDASDAKA